MKKSQDPDDPGFKLFTGPVHKAHIVSCPQGVVTYTLADEGNPWVILKQHVRPSDKDQQIRDILAANPDVDLQQLEGPLGIKIVNFQKSKPAPKPTESKKPGIHISFDHE